MFNATSLIGRNALKVEEFAARPGQEIEKWVPLGMGDFNDEDGCVSVGAASSSNYGL